MARAIVLLSIFILFTGSGFRPAEEVNWVSFEEAVELSKKKPKKILVDLYTDWCGWCKKMDRDTYQHEKLAKYINERFYAVKFNAEQRESIEFDGHTFKYVPSGNRGVHELAAALTNNKLSYPTTVFLDEELRIITPVPGYMNANSFDPVLKYIGENKYKDTSWKEFEENYTPSF